MRKTFRYRMYPTKHQETLLLRQFGECCWLYNYFLAQRRDSYKHTGESPNYYDQKAELPKLKSARPSLASVHSQVLQNVALRVDFAFQMFFRRVKLADKAGYPRFKGRHRYHSITYPQVPSGCGLTGNRLTLSKIGEIEIVLSRPLEGKPKTCVIKRSSTGKWFANFCCELTRPEPLPKSTEQVGIDVGLKTFAAFSNGEKIARKRFFKTDQKELAKAQKKFAKEPIGTTKRSCRRKVVARIHERISNRRSDFAHKESRKVVARFGFIAVENLEINLMKGGNFSKDISDAAWYLFFTLLFFKAESAGRIAVRVNPAYTSQTCSRCGRRQKMPLSKRVFHCPECELKMDRDHNAACNILRLGLQSHGIQPEESSGFGREE